MLLEVGIAFYHQGVKITGDTRLYHGTIALIGSHDALEVWVIGNLEFQHGTTRNRLNVYYLGLLGQG